MTGTQILAAFEAIGAVVRLTPAGIVDVESPDVPEFERLCAEVKANRSEVVAELKRHAAPLAPSEAGGFRPCLDCGHAADELTLFCPPCWDRRRERGRLLAFDSDRLRRHEARAARTAAALAERFCPACGFSAWRASPRGDASCYACELLRAGKRVRCAACGLEEWRRDEHGHARCATCHGGDARVAAPPVQTRPEPTSREFPAPRGTA